MRIIATGGTFYKNYDEIRGELTFKDSHLPGILKQARLTTPIVLEINQLIRRQRGRGWDKRGSRLSAAGHHHADEKQTAQPKITAHTCRPQHFYCTTVTGFGETRQPDTRKNEYRVC
jgi:hypothetical protein